MSASQKTPNYDLPIFQGSDALNTAGFNNAMIKIDEVMHQNSQTGDTQTAELKELTENVSTLTETQTSMLNTLGTNAGDISSLKTRQENTDTHINDIDEQIAGIQTNVSTLQQNSTTQSGDISKLTSDVAATKTGLGNAQSSIDNLTTTVTNLENDTQSLSQNIENIKEDISDLDNQSKSLDDRIKNLESNPPSENLVLQNIYYRDNVTGYPDTNATPTYSYILRPNLKEIKFVMFSADFTNQATNYLAQYPNLYLSDIQVDVISSTNKLCGGFINSKNQLIIMGFVEPSDTLTIKLLSRTDTLLAFGSTPSPLSFSLGYINTSLQ